MGKNTLKRQRDNAPAEIDSAQAPKRARQGADVKLAKLYDDLAAESEETRLEAAKQIIVSFSPENEPSAQNVEKALNRLIRGLCSSRKAARFGFCITLTELLRLFFGKPENKIQGLNLDINGIIDLVEERTKVQGKVPGKDRRDHLIGKLFGFKAIIQSKILTEPTLSLDSYSKVLDHIYEMARDVPWLREECGLILVEATSSLDGQPTQRDCAKELVQRLISFNLANTPEGVAIWLTVKARCEDVLPTNVWKEQDPLSKKEWAKLAKVLKEDFRNTSENGESENIKSGGANPNPIFAWDLVISEVLRRDQDAARAEFPHFWRDIVDNNLFSSSASHERKSWGFKLFATLIKAAPEDALSALFSPNLVRSLINQSKKDDRFLHAASVAALNAIQVRVTQAPSSALPIMVAMTTKIGPTDLFKTQVQIMLSTDDKTLRKIVRHIHSLILRPDTQEQAMADTRRRAIADLLLSVVRDYKHYGSENFLTGEEHDTWLRNILDVMVEFAYFVPSKDAKTNKVPLPAVSDATRKVFQERLSSILTRLLSVETESRSSFALMAVGLIRSKATASKSLDLVFKADESILKTVNKAFKTVDTIATKDSKSGKKSAAEGFILLYCLALLQVYDGDGDAVLLLDDLDSSRKALLKGKKDSSAQGQDVFVEIILSFLGNPRTLFKKIAQEAFGIFAEDLTADGLQSLTDILETAETLEGQKELFNQAGDEEEEAESDDDVEDVEDMSDVEMVDGEIKKTGGNDTDDSDMESEDDDASDDEGSSADSDSDDASDDDEEDDMEGDNEELENFDKLLALTLGTKKPSMNGEDGDDSDDSDMDDEQMMALDPHLEKVFKERSKLSNKKKREEAKQTVVQFKARVLDLLAIFLEKQYSNPLTLDVLLPLLRRIRAGANEQLAERCSKLLKTYTDTRSHHKAPLPKPDNIEGVWETLKGIHEEAKDGGGSARHATACSNASLMIVKILVGLGRANYAQVVDVYAEAQKEWFAEKKSAVQPVLFTQFLNWSVSVHKQGK